MYNSPHESDLAVVTWDQVRGRVRTINPQLAACIDAIDPGVKLPFILARYAYGEDIVQSGQLQLPKNAKPLQSVRQLFNYADIPVALLLNNSVEVYFQTRHRVISDKLWRAGNLFGVWELFDRAALANSTQHTYLSAGARSIFTLANISNQIYHQRLQRSLDIKLSPPYTLTQQRDVFAAIMDGLELQQPWRCEVLYFSKHWFKETKEIDFLRLKNYFYQVAWEQSYNCRKYLQDNIVWESYLYHLSQKNLYLKPSVLAHIKQLLLISEGVFPGMVFSDCSNQEVAPLDQIKRAYSEIYGVKQSPLLFMHPAHISQQSSVYYSLNYPNYFDPYMPTKSTPRLAEELSAIGHAIELLKSENFFSKDTTYRYFHNLAQSTAIANVKSLPTNDSTLTRYFKANPNESFPSKNSFFNGCVRIENN